GSSGTAASLPAADPVGQRLPLRIALRLPVLAAGVELGAARLVLQRHRQQPALRRDAGKDETAGHLEVLARLFLVPGPAGRQRLQPERGAPGMAGDAAGVS